MGKKDKKRSADNNEVRDDPGTYRVQRDTLRQFNAVLQRDATDTTYKYALLRALVEIAEQESHLVKPVDEEWVRFPLGLIVEKWLYYYYPFVERRLPQRHGESPRAGKGPGLAFRRPFQVFTDYYTRRGGLTAFVLDLRERGVPREIEPDFRALIGKLRGTIIRYPMNHLGFSWYGDYYQIVRPAAARHRRRLHSPVNRESLVAGLGEAELRRGYFETFRAVGGFATGAEAIFAQWARFTERANPGEPVTLAEATEALLTAPEDERNVRAAEQIYRALIAQRGSIECAWSGASIGGRRALAIDHAIPFSLWGSNALWNLLPATRAVNADKSDRIPSPDLIGRRGERIIEYWQAFRAGFDATFQSEFRLSLAGMEVDFHRPGWSQAGIRALQEKCDYLIAERGFEPWVPG